MSRNVVQSDRLRALETLDDVIGSYRGSISGLQQGLAAARAMETPPPFEHLQNLESQIDGALAVIERLLEVRRVVNDAISLAQRRSRRDSA